MGLSVLVAPLLIANPLQFVGGEVILPRSTQSIYSIASTQSSPGLFVAPVYGVLGNPIAPVLES